MVAATVVASLLPAEEGFGFSLKGAGGVNRVEVDLSNSISPEQWEEVFRSRLFQDWLHLYSRADRMRLEKLAVKHIQLQQQKVDDAAAVDGDTCIPVVVGVSMEVEATDRAGERVREWLVLQPSRRAVLVLLRNAKTNFDCCLFVRENSLSINSTAALSLVEGQFDNQTGRFTGAAAAALEKLLGVCLYEKDMVNMTGIAFGAGAGVGVRCCSAAAYYAARETAAATATAAAGWGLTAISAGIGGVAGGKNNQNSSANVQLNNNTNSKVVGAGVGAASNATATTAAEEKKQSKVVADCDKKKGGGGNLLLRESQNEGGVVDEAENVLPLLLEERVELYLYRCNLEPQELEKVEKLVGRLRKNQRNVPADVSSLLSAAPPPAANGVPEVALEADQQQHPQSPAPEQQPSAVRFALVQLGEAWNLAADAAAVSALFLVHELRYHGLMPKYRPADKGAQSAFIKDTAVVAAPKAAAVYANVAQLDPNSKGVNLRVRVHSPIVFDGERTFQSGRTRKEGHMVVGDAHGIITLKVADQQLDLPDELGTALLIRNARIAMEQGHMKLVVNRWGKISSDIPEDEDKLFPAQINDAVDMSATEYELVVVKDDEFDGEESVGGGTHEQQQPQPLSAAPGRSGGRGRHGAGGVRGGRAAGAGGGMGRGGMRGGGNGRRGNNYRGRGYSR